MARNQGARALARTGETQESIGTKLGVSRVSVCHWLAGETKPNKERRREIESQFGVAPHLWDQEVTKSPTMAAPKPEASTMPDDGIPDGVLGKNRFLEEMAHQMLVELKNDGSATYLEKAKVMNSVAATLKLIAQVTGQFELGSRLFKLPVWKRIEEALYRGLEGHPEAALAVAAELRRVESEQLTL